jgi:hypothetical protein
VIENTEINQYDLFDSRKLPSLKNLKITKSIFKNSLQSNQRLFQFDKIRKLELYDNECVFNFLNDFILDNISSQFLTTVKLSVYNPKPSDLLMLLRKVPATKNCHLTIISQQYPIFLSELLSMQCLQTHTYVKITLSKLTFLTQD